MQFQFRYVGVLVTTFLVSFYSLNLEAKIPVSHIKGVDELFPKHLKTYSPLIGLVYHQEFIQNYYHFGRQQDQPLSRLFEMLFTELPGGEITNTHLNKNPGTHLSMSAVAKIFISLESLKSQSLDLITLKARLKENIRAILQSDSEYINGLAQADILLDKINSEYNQFLLKLEKNQEEGKLAEQFNNENIVPLNRQLSNLKKGLKQKAKPQDNTQMEALITPQISQLEEQRAALTKQYQEMRKSILTGDEKKAAEKNFIYQKEINNTQNPAYVAQLEKLIELLMECFASYEIKQAVVTQDEASPSYFQNATSITLLSYLWMKYTDKTHLRDYLQAWASANLLDAKEWKKLPSDFYTLTHSEEDYSTIKKNFSNAWKKQSWIQKHFSEAIAFILDAQSGMKVPDVVSFSYLKWSRYSLYPDCGENVLHNIFNLITYNPQTGNFDYRILEKLKETDYPNLNVKVIDYYKQYEDFESHNKIPAAKDWIQVVSHLNDGFENLPKEQQIHYRKSYEHVASPYSNLIKVINRLFGLPDITQDQLAGIFKSVQNISGFEIKYSNQKMKSSGFGSAYFSAENHLYTTRSHRPIHLNFYLKKDNSDSTLHEMSKLIPEKNAFLHRTALAALMGRGIQIKDRSKNETNYILLFSQIQTEQDQIEVIEKVRHNTANLDSDLYNEILKTLNLEEQKALQQGL
jgi:hypothetical protein